jgi:hypothetical protein
MGDELKLNENLDKASVEQKRSKFRNVLFRIIDNKPSISSIEMNEDEGDISFSVAVKDIGLEQIDFYKYHNEIYSNFIVDFLGELLVRENISTFVELISSLENENYFDVMNKCEHKRFGMRFEKGLFIFSFHISFLQRILTENFKHKVK